MESRRGAPASYLATNATDPSTAKWLNGYSSSYHAVMRRLRAGEGVNICESNGVRPLHIAAKRGAISQLKHLLEDGADPTLCNVRGQTPLDYAHRFHQLEVVCFLILHDAIIEELTKELERTPTLDELYAAMNDDEFRCFRASIKKRVEVRGAKLVKAARRDDLEVVRAMIESKEANVNDVLHTTGETAFSAALSSGRYAMCEYLLACGAHMNAACLVVDELPCSALAMAVRSGDVHLVKRLVACGMDRYTPPCGLQDCALLQAIKIGSTAMVDAMFELKVPIYTIRLAERLSMPPLAAVLLNSLANKRRGWLSLYIACWLQDLRLVEHLLATHPELQLQDPTDMAWYSASALFLAVYQQNEQIVVALMRRGASITQVVGGKLAFKAAVAIDSVRMLHFLLTHGADVNITVFSIGDVAQVSFLTFAVQTGAMECAHALLRLEMRPDYRDKALCEAVKRGDLEFVRLMLDGALPSTEKAFISCVKTANCSVLLDLLLSRCCAETFPISVVEPAFASVCAQAVRPISSDLVAVFLAHGLDVMYNTSIASTPDAQSLDVLQNEGLPCASSIALQYYVVGEDALADILGYPPLID